MAGMGRELLRGKRREEGDSFVPIGGGVTYTGQCRSLFQSVIGRGVVGAGRRGGENCQRHMTHTHTHTHAHTHTHTHHTHIDERILEPRVKV